jgi:hypothetical protein
MRQRDISKYRIMRAFAISSRALTQREIIQKSGLKRAAVSPCVGELIRQGRLAFSIGKDGKTRTYKRIDPHDPALLIFFGLDKRSQVVRLQRLGLRHLEDFIWIPRPRGRPKGRQPNFELMDQLWDLDRRGIEQVKSAGIHIKQTGWPLGDGLSFSLPGRSRPDMVRRIQKAISEANQAQKKREPRKSLGSIELTRMEKRRLMPHQSRLSL